VKVIPISYIHGIYPIIGQHCFYGVVTNLCAMLGPNFAALVAYLLITEISSPPSTMFSAGATFSSGKPPVPKIAQPTLKLIAPD
jgi:hypothetical protein